jgi:hypothetical protein
MLNTITKILRSTADAARTAWARSLAGQATAGADDVITRSIAAAEILGAGRNDDGLFSRRRTEVFVAATQAQAAADAEQDELDANRYRDWSTLYLDCLHAGPDLTALRGSRDYDRMEDAFDDPSYALLHLSLLRDAVLAHPDCETLPPDANPVSAIDRMREPLESDRATASTLREFMRLHWLDHQAGRIGGAYGALDGGRDDLWAYRTQAAENLGLLEPVKGYHNELTADGLRYIEERVLSTKPQ